ncbi:MAG: RagB/SusD family nutrient uptake outer membrane protein [Duncaniella sp.]|nr:RagB/SusD family nutrient uptake outer membrane protein [Duncaniella sp.]HBI57782.1 RagB/SusD family nutrient uptake outer membrane protein [Porphyromonadaceae bacterium]
MRKLIQHTLSAAFIGVAMTAFTGCSDFLDKQPSNELSEEKTYADWRMFEYFHNDTYNFLLHGANRINGSWLDAATDLAETSFASGGTLTTFNIGNYYGNAGAAELVSVWESRYRGIRKCNRVLNDMDRVPYDITRTAEENEALRATTRAEARTFRAWFYWELFLRYGPVPVITDVLDPDDDMITPYKNRPTIKEYVVDFVLKELQESEPDLLNYADAWSSNRIGRLSQPMSRALQSRILLYMASPRYAQESGITWQQAADAAKKFIDDYSSNFGLFAEENLSPSDNYANALLRTQYTGNNNEVIFFRNDVVINWSGIMQDTPVGEGGNGGNCPSQNLVDMYDMVDGSSPFTSYDVTGAPVYSGGVPTVNAASGYSDADMWSNRDPRLAATILYQGQPWGTMRVGATIDVRPGMADNPTGNANATPTGYYMRKYIPASILASNHAGTAYRLWTIIRYAEILLNYAEALNEVQGPCQEVYDMLDMVRHRAGITGSVADRADLAGKDAMRNFIHKERTVEFAFEEHRPWDVRRWNCAVEALSRPIYGVNVAMDGTVTRKVAQNRVFEPRMYLYPIPETEVWKTDIENNPGW